jgi:hypothetical protein
MSVHLTCKNISFQGIFKLPFDIFQMIGIHSVLGIFLLITGLTVLVVEL